MKPYSEYQAIVNKDCEVITRPESKYAYWAYSNGNSIKCETRTEALAISKVVERINVNKDEINAYNKEQQRRANEAYMLWYADLCERHNDVSEKVFVLCLRYATSFAEDSCDYDSIADKMNDMFLFLNDYNTLVEAEKS